MASCLSFISFYAMTSLEEMLTNETFVQGGFTLEIISKSDIILQFYLKLQKLLLLGKVCKFTKFQGRYLKKKER